MNNGSLPAEQDHGTDDLVLQTISHLEELLTEKDQLGTALTVQLEEAAERIDRLQRQGNDRGARGGGIGSIPVEMLEEQRNIAENVERFVVQWEEAQPTAALARIEMQLIELRELVVSQSGGGSPSSETAPHAAQQSASSLAGWEAMKANLLQGNEPEEVVESAEPAEEDLEAEITIPPPNPVPPDADTRILHLAIEQRDAYIAALQQAMQRAELRHRKAAVLGGGDDVPESLQHRLAELEHIFQEQQRLAEVELSLERARLGREEMRLRHVDETLTRELKRLGVQSGKPAAERPTEEAGRNARWRRILGIVKPEGE
ncbi:MAG: hypothetical protein IT428_13735 [Planctomycetaceae bacterium]|nr:hypothetical protein [Planctomycetaceae bacterium]